MDNQTLTNILLQYASFLSGRQDNIYRRRAYRQAAETVLRLERPVADIVTAEGRAGLMRLPGIGAHLAYTIEGLVRTGEFRTLTADEGDFAACRLVAGATGGLRPPLAG